MIHALSERRVGTIAIALLVLFEFALPAWLSAQVVGAAVSGRVVDPSGAVTPGASVSIENVATGSIAKGVTNAVGFYSIPNLPPGTYEIKTSAPGFATEVRSGITLTVGEELVLNVSKGSIGKRTGNAAPCSFTGTQRCARPSMRSRISGTRRSL